MKFVTARKEILENLQVKFPTAKISVRKATDKAGPGVAYIATIKNKQQLSSVRDLPKIMILSFDSSGKEIQNSDI